MTISSPAAGAPRPQRLILFGRVIRRWQPALSAERLGAIDGITEFMRIKRWLRMWLLPRAERRRSIIMSVTEPAMRRCPRDGWMLIPSRGALDVLGNKLRFARYVEEEGLTDYVPRRHVDPELAPYPAVLKLERGSAGSAVAVVRSPRELNAARRRMPRSRFRRTLLQELVEGEDHVAHAICRDGRLVWHCTYDYELEPGDVVQTWANVIGWRRGRLSADEVAILERFLVPLQFDGPIAVDFRRRADGRLCVMEINPRFGGSLMKPEHAEDLEAALAAIVAHAKPPPG